MKVMVNMPEDFTVFFEEEEFEGLSEREKGLLIQKALSEVVMEQIIWFSLPNDDKAEI